MLTQMLKKLNPRNLFMHHSMVLMVL
uniref:Uncharacterized protein n=1 Tax=Arundo donax TaxID=35708 RepID=A0A0A9B6Q4_ARUDO